MGHAASEFMPVSIAVLTVSDTRAMLKIPPDIIWPMKPKPPGIR
ncbi:Uncharacterised protein [Budvicia aquatica]|uniref:Uncharacterized protein n=1 Tax=Budvicia aquatica TaxID=82979 RepID=A0A484ZLM6_9GAMM|nr:Uncharacterised protein [Budvicia aquatica]